MNEESMFVKWMKNECLWNEWRMNVCEMNVCEMNEEWMFVEKVVQKIMIHVF